MALVEKNKKTKRTKQKPVKKKRMKAAKENKKENKDKEPTVNKKQKVTLGPNLSSFIFSILYDLEKLEILIANIDFLSK